MTTLRFKWIPARWAAAWLITTSALMNGCGEGKAPMRPGDRPRPENSDRHPVVISSASSVAIDPRERARQEGATIDSIVARLPEEYRVRGRAILEDRTASISFQASSDPEIARLLGVLMAIRDASSADQLKQAERDRAAAEENAKTHVRVTVALAPATVVSKGRAVVTRRPGDGGRPVLLLREADATAADLTAGLAAAARLAAKYGPEPANKIRIVISSTRADTAASGITDRHIELLRSSIPQPIAGVGVVHTLDMMTKLPAPRPR